VRLLSPPGLQLQVLGAPAQAALVLANGAQVGLPTGSSGYWDMDDSGARVFQCELRAEDLPARPVRLVWRLALKSDPGTRMHFREQSGAGTRGYREPAGGKRAKVDWKDASLGLVVRQLCTAYGLQVSSMGDSGYWFSPGELPKRSEVLANGVGFAVTYVNQW